MKTILKLWTILIVLFCFFVANAQEKSSVKAKRIPYIEVIDCYGCNEFVISLPSPKHPALVGFGAHKYNGIVSVQILIDEAGMVETATGISGHPYFRPMLEKEALKAIFKPKIVDGKPTKIRGVIVYQIVSRRTHQVSAQKSSVIKRVPATTIISCGVCNQEAIYLPKPEYPKSALFINVSGSVNVQVVIDKKGNVQSAKALSGHPLLRSAAVKAALNAKFEPFLLGKKPVKVSGMIVYNFVL